MNRLAQESSLYLQQHAENPVDWFPWGKEAFKKAQEENKPLLISIGYSACHWCHVMAHESFEDDYIAKLMNTHFVCIKVDKEERPDIDKIYMESVQMMQGQAGWPLNVFCLPDGRPFAGGTYFPPDESRGVQIVPWPQLLMRVSDFFQKNRKDLEENAEAVVGNLQATNQPVEVTGDPVDSAQLFKAVQALSNNHDDTYGGFSTAPKFPPAMTLDFLLAMRGTATMEIMNPEMATRVDTMVNMTLTAMAHGGLYDQVGGGFARYCVDQTWHIPHFEKMLYDNALLLGTYTRGWQRYRNPLFKAVVEESINWLTREMRDPNGGFHSTIDADSEGEEGKFYLWTPKEIKEVLGEDEGQRFCDAYGVSEEGNFEHTGKNHLILLEPDFSIRETFAEARQKLLHVRNQRVPPARDDKKLVAWNALLIDSLAEAAFTFGRKDWMTLAANTAEWLWSNARFNEDRLYSVAYGNQFKNNGLLDDYAYTAQAFLTLASKIDALIPGQDNPWLERARIMTQSTLRHFKDSTALGYFYTSEDHEPLIHRKKDWFDNATPAGNSVLLHVFSQLAVLDGDSQFARECENLKAAYPGILERAPAAISHALTAITQDAMGVAVIKFGEEISPAALRENISERPWRRLFCMKDSQASNGKYQLCVGTQCLSPESNPNKLQDLL